MKRQRNLGFTLVELLVVITIIGMLMGMLVPAVQAVRENMRRAQCTNSVKNVTAAAIGYNTAMNVFPGYTNVVGGTTVGWGAMLLPNLDRRELWDALRAKKSDWKKPMPIMICQTDLPDSVSGTSGPSAYTANGLIFRDAGPQTQYPPRSLDYVTSNDGAGTTVLISENLRVDLANTSDPMHWQHDWWTTDQLKVSFGFPVDYGGANNSKDPYAGAYPQEMGQNVKSAHSGGVNVSFCDGHCQFLSEDAGFKTVPGDTLTVYRQLVTPDGALRGDGSNPEPPMDTTLY